MPVITESDGKGDLKPSVEKSEDNKESHSLSDKIHHMAHKATPGPAQNEKMPEKEKDEDLDKRFHELNKTT